MIAYRVDKTEITNKTTFTDTLTYKTTYPSAVATILKDAGKANLRWSYASETVTMANSNQYEWTIEPITIED